MFFLQLWAFQVKKEGGVLAMAKYDFTNGGKSSKAGLGYSSPQAQVPPQPHPKERALPDATLVESFVEFDRTTSRFGHWLNFLQSPLSVASTDRVSHWPLF